MRSDAAKRAQIRALSRTLAHASALVTAASGFLLFLAPPVEWRFVAGVLVGIGLYLAAEALIPFYAYSDDDAEA